MIQKLLRAKAPHWLQTPSGDRGVPPLLLPCRGVYVPGGTAEQKGHEKPVIAMPQDPILQVELQELQVEKEDSGSCPYRLSVKTLSIFCLSSLLVDDPLTSSHSYFTWQFSTSTRARLPREATRLLELKICNDILPPELYLGHRRMNFKSLFQLNDGDNRVECLWVRVRGKANKADIMVGVCYRPPNQDEEADKIFYKQLREVFNLPDVCWKYNTAETIQSRRFLECVELTQLVSEPTREGAPLDLLFANREGPVGDVMVGGRLGHSDYEMIEFLILGEVRSGVSRTATLDFQREDFGLFRSLVDRVPWEVVMDGKGVQKGWTFLKKEILKTSQPGRRAAWLNRELWLELRGKKSVDDLWKKGQATQEDYKDVVRLCTEKIRRAKAQLELNLATAIKDNKIHFYKSISNKRRAKENPHPLLDVGGNIVAKDEEKAEVLNAFFDSVFNSKTSYSWGTQPPELEDRDGEHNEAPIIPGEMVSDLLPHLDTHKSMGLDGIRPRVLRELAEMLNKLLSIIYQQSWLTEEVPVDWSLANVMSTYKKGRKEDLRIYRPVSLTLVPGKVMEQIILSAIT
ncbi:hypothetical protein QYF61_027013 [Mycteria americana]|uniref:Rna-directed dna polymerase from mobile element jockey-like n=1 Tax=Mycteria americana TaxID=33587 RepID=A0AAN7P072_MYCAM|nr:hypothetical protein QYF61_027013 [Mycteria americana]